MALSVGEGPPENKRHAEVARIEAAHCPDRVSGQPTRYHCYRLFRFLVPNKACGKNYEAFLLLLDPSVLAPLCLGTSVLQTLSAHAAVFEKIISYARRRTDPTRRLTWLAHAVVMHVMQRTCSAKRAASRPPVLGSTLKAEQSPRGEGTRPSLCTQDCASI